MTAAEATGHDPFAAVLTAIEATGNRVQRRGTTAQAQCPAHPDRTPSLTITTSPDGKALLHCHAGCNTGDILQAINLPPQALFPDYTPNPIATVTPLHHLRAWNPTQPAPPTQPKGPPPARHLTNTWTYHDADGHPVAIVRRYQLTDTTTGEIIGKTFTQHALNPDGTPKPGLDGLPVPLYQAPAIAAAITNGTPIVICEGEKDADTATKLGMVATTCPQGAGSWQPHHTQQLARAAHITVIADNDTPGLAHATHIATQLPGTRILVPADGCKDLTEHVATGHDITQLTPYTPPPTEPTRTSWWPRDLTATLNGHDPEPDPAHLTRDDGINLFYPGRINGLIGESESGKTWVALLAILQATRRRQPVILLDFEDTAAGIIERLTSMGATHDNLTHLTYIAPDESLTADAARDLADTLATTNPHLVVLDGFNAAMTLLGLDLNSNTDATKFAQQLLTPLARTAAAVVYVDHVPKAKDARGKGGIGAQAKRAMTTGCAITVNVLDDFGRGMTGRLGLTIDKDRPGKVRAHAHQARHIGEAIIDSTRAHTVTVTITTAAAAGHRPTTLMQTISDYLASCQGQEATSNQVRKNVTGNNQHIDHALDVLRAEGFVARLVGDRNSWRHHLITPFTSLSEFKEDR